MLTITSSSPPSSSSSKTSAAVPPNAEAHLERLVTQLIKSSWGLQVHPSSSITFIQMKTRLSLITADGA
ncbi:hypothetical protein NQZ68_013818 [Dissostichus eleginoides]|nr:hypothetical protein NQZ68_013818 [Dissostichus eleginoides]